MAYYPFAPENDALYRLVFGTNVATFNDPLDANFVGMISEITGLDGAEVRESSEDIVQADGAVHGDFYLGRRPIVITGRSYGHATTTQRNARLDRLKRAANALRADATLSWKPSLRRENQILDPSFERGVTTNEFNNGSGVTIAVVSGEQSRTPSNALRLTATGTASMVVTQNSNVGRFSVAAGHTYTGSGYVYNAVGSRTAQINFRFYDSAGVEGVPVISLPTWTPALS